MMLTQYFPLILCFLEQQALMDYRLNVHSFTKSGDIFLAVSIAEVMVISVCVSHPVFCK